MSRLMAAIAAHRNREREMDGAIPVQIPVQTMASRPPSVGAQSTLPSPPSAARPLSPHGGQAQYGVQPAGGHIANAIGEWRNGRSAAEIERPTIGRPNIDRSSTDWSQNVGDRTNALPKTPGLDRLVGIATAPTQTAYRPSRGDEGQSRDGGGPTPGGGGVYMEDPWDAARRLLAEEENHQHSAGQQNVNSRGNGRENERENAMGWDNKRTNELLDRLGVRDGGYKSQAAQGQAAQGARGNVSGVLTQPETPSRRPSIAERSRMEHNSRSNFVVPTFMPKKTGQSHGLG